MPQSFAHNHPKSNSLAQSMAGNVTRIHDVSITDSQDSGINVLQKE